MANASHTRAFAAFVSEPEAFASILPEIERCQRMSNAWDDACQRLAEDHREYRAKLEKSPC